MLVLVGAAALGTTMGAVLGAAQAWSLRHHVRHPWRWVAGSAAGWTAAMPVVFLGATGVGADWPWWSVVAAGTLTGLAAGLVLGATTSPFLEALDGPAWHHRVVLGFLAAHPRWAPDAVVDGGLVGLEVVGSRTGHRYRFPVEAAPWPPDRLVVLPAHSEGKTWWRNLAACPAVEVLVSGS